MIFSMFLLCFGISLSCVLSARILIHYFQLESYQFPGYFMTVRRNLKKAMSPGIFMAVILAVLLSFCVLIRNHIFASLIIFVIFPSAGFLAGKIFSEKKAKKALAFTPRIKRLYSVSIFVLFLLLFLLG